MARHVGHTLLFALLNLAIIASVRGSSGDYAMDYRECAFHSCLQQCDPDRDLTWLQREVFQWNCPDECKYTCMMQREEEKKQFSAQFRTQHQHQHHHQYEYAPEKYYGHWPYERLWGLQEPAASLFSLLNVLPHAWFHCSRLPQLRKLVARASSGGSRGGGDGAGAGYMLPWLSVYPFVGYLAWFASTCYHARKLDATAQVDFMGALVLLVYAVWCAVRRVLGDMGMGVGMGVWMRTRLGMGGRGDVNEANAGCIAVVFSVVCVLTLWRLHSMYRNEISFEGHMTLCISLAVVHTAVWVVWLLWLWAGGWEEIQRSRCRVSAGDGDDGGRQLSGGAAGTTGVVEASRAHSVVRRRGDAAEDFGATNGKHDDGVTAKIPVVSVHHSIPSRKWLCLACQVWFSVAALVLEVGDFPPQLRYFDAHALWHAATIPLGFLWYIFWENEIREG